MDAASQDDEHSSPFPIEVWGEILSHLGKRDLPAATLVCAALRWLAQSLMFNSFNYSSAEDPEDPAVFHSKLAFSTSSHIAPHVRACKLGGVQGVISETIFRDALPRFLNLRRLTLEAVQMTPTMLIGLARISLTALVLIDCPGDLGVPRESISVEELAIRHAEKVAAQDAQWLKVFNPTVLRYLLTGTEISTAALVSRLKMLHLPALEILSLDSRGLFHVNEVDFVSALSSVPALRALELRTGEFNGVPWPDWSSHLPSTVLPRLASFSGPQHLVPVFCATRRITRLSVHGKSRSHMCNSNTIGGHLGTVARDRDDAGLASLELRVSPSLSHLLQMVVSAFPGLRSLRFALPAGIVFALEVNSSILQQSGI
ncbi:hypothetical protein C8F04DRAFT_386406 [Mycena alexandri]|uniref:F-box domain-containing protein n=1 Tax=Mycena alexandri TaxID=1745969 RepID=A0AAD6T264_9AGAR|nr:hypothetical protein C8F04DRAFT_386406 [Mycena alexandri]